jgi:hypothetical protein
MSVKETVKTAANAIANDAKGKAGTVKGAVAEHGFFGAARTGMKTAWQKQPLLVGIAGVAAAHYAYTAFKGHHQRKLEQQQAQELSR